MPALVIRPLAARAEAEACARMMAETEPWITLRRDYQACLHVLLDETRERYVGYRDDRLAGFLILNLKGAFVGYIQTVCAAPEFRGKGIGSALVAFAEERIFRDHRNAFICVSSFNHGARRLYERLGYQLVGELTDYVVAGHSELLLRKSRGPLASAGAEVAAAGSAFVPLHVERSGALQLALPLAQAFALLTPEGERRWIQGWEPEYLHPRGAPEPPPAGTLFRTRHGGEETLWLVLAFDAEAAAVDYVRLTPGSRIGTVSVRARAKGDATEAEIRYRLTGLSPEGNGKLAELTPEAFSAMLRRWEAAIRAATA